jgi:predicted aldo/keto reductase-like oxidoreductase
MLYYNFKGFKLSALGFGNMRLPTLENKAIDVAEADRLIAYARDNGVNSFDTAFGYHGGESEPFIGKSLARYPRDSWLLASKFPGYENRVTWNPAEVFESQLKKCGVDYFDFYLFHNVYERNLKTYRSPDWGIADYLLAQKKAGRIRHLGFSSHAFTPTFMEFLDFIGQEIEFGQIQLNALDWTLQDAKTKYNALVERDIPVWVMEPVRGGRLAALPEEALAKLKLERPQESAAGWAFRWLQTLPKIGVTLSGMSKMSDVEENVKIFAENKPLSEAEKKLYESVVGNLSETVPCTACRYCCPDCPKDLDIPTFLALYNDCLFEPSGIAKMAVGALKPSKRPAACVACGACADICPQKIDVPRCLSHFQTFLDNLPDFIPPVTEIE